jgi:hypothetical protein
LIAPEPLFDTVGVGNAFVGVIAADAPDAPNGVAAPVAVTPKMYDCVPLVRLLMVHVWTPVGGVAVLATVHVPLDVVKPVSAAKYAVAVY